MGYFISGDLFVAIVTFCFDFCCIERCDLFSSMCVNRFEFGENINMFLSF